MTVNHEQVPAEPEAADAKPVALDHEAPDVVLVLLVDLINRIPGTEASVTLTVGGVLFSGLLISGRSYFEYLQEDVAGDGTDEWRTAFAQFFAEFADIYPEAKPAAVGADEAEESEEADAAAGSDEARSTVYVHMRAVSIHTPGSAGTLNQGLWRGRLSQVDGWSMGSFGPKPPPRSIAR